MCVLWRVIMILVFRKTNEWLCDEQNVLRLRITDDELQEQHRDSFDTNAVLRRKGDVSSQSDGGGSYQKQLKNAADSWFTKQLSAVFF